MTAVDTELSTRPTRRRGCRGGKPRPKCAREGCTSRLRKGESSDCCFMCRLITEELKRTLNVCTALGAEGVSSELWAEAVAVSDGWTRFLQLDRQLYRAALAVGITNEQYQAIKAG